MKRLLVFAILLMPLSANAAGASFFHKSCKSDETTCVAYIRGMFDGISLGALKAFENSGETRQGAVQPAENAKNDLLGCIPTPVDPTLLYMAWDEGVDNNPQLLNASMAVSVLVVFKGSFPCN